MENTEIIKALRECEYCDVCSIAVDGDCPFGGRNALEVAAADALEAADKRIARLEEDLKTREAEREVMQDTIKICEEAADRYKEQIPKEGECDAANVNGVQSDEDKAVMDCSYCPSADGCFEAFSESTLCRKLRRENERSER